MNAPRTDAAPPPPRPERARRPPRLPAGAATALVAVAWAFLPIQHLPSFDTVKLAVLTLAAAFLSIRALRRSGGTEPLLSDPLAALPCALATAAAVGAALSWPRGSFVGPATALTAFVVARAAIDGRSADDAFTSTLRATAAASAGIGAYAIVQALGFDPAPWGARREVVSTLGNTSFAAEWQAAALPLALVLALRGGGRADRLLGAAASGMAGLHLVLARSRIDVAAAAAAIAVVAAFLARSPGTARRILAGAGVAGACAAAAFVAAGTGGASIVGRSDTITVRLAIWAGSLRAFAADPFRLGGTPFIDLFPPHRSPAEYRMSFGRDVDTPHFDLLEIAATTGVVGVVVATASAWLLVRRLRALGPERRFEAAALAGAATALVVSGLASSPLTHPATALLGALVVAHVVAFAPRPFRALRTGGGGSGARIRRAADLACVAAACLAFWPGPAFRNLRSDAFLALGRSERQAGDGARALLLLDAAAAVDPQAYAARFELGTALLHGGRPAEAADALSAANALRPRDPECQVNLVHALRAAGRPEEAAALLARSLDAVPWHPLLLTARAAAEIDRGDAAAAVATLDRALVHANPHDLRPRAVRADALLLRDADEAARVEALDVLAALHAAGDTATLRRAAAAYARRDALFLAVLTTRARRIVATEPALAAALVLAPADGRTPEDAGFLADAARILQQAERPEDARRLTGRSQGLRARAALDAGDVDGALRFARAAAERDPSAAHHVLEALALARRGERRAVREALAAAVALGPVDAAAIRSDPGIASLLPDAEIERSLQRSVPPGPGEGPQPGAAPRPGRSPGERRP